MVHYFDTGGLDSPAVDYGDECRYSDASNPGIPAPGKVGVTNGRRGEHEQHHPETQQDKEKDRHTVSQGVT